MILRAGYLDINLNQHIESSSIIVPSVITRKRVSILCEENTSAVFVTPDVVMDGDDNENESISLHSIATESLISTIPDFVDLLSSEHDKDTVVSYYYIIHSPAILLSI